MANGHRAKNKSAPVNKRKPKEPVARRRGITTPPAPARRARATRKPSPELVEILMLAGCSRERILELTGCQAAVLGSDEYPRIHGPRSAPVRTANLLARLLELGEVSKSVPDVVQILKIFGRLHLPEISGAIDDSKNNARASTSGSHESGIKLYLPDNGRGPSDA